MRNLIEKRNAHIRTQRLFLATTLSVIHLLLGKHFVFENNFDETADNLICMCKRMLFEESARARYVSLHIIHTN